MHFSRLRCFLIVFWFLGLLAWNVPPAWFAVSDTDKLRSFIVVLGAMATPTCILLSVAVIALILFVDLKPSAPY